MCIRDRASDHDICLAEEFFIDQLLYGLIQTDFPAFALQDIEQHQLRCRVIRRKSIVDLRRYLFDRADFHCLIPFDKQRNQLGQQG